MNPNPQAGDSTTGQQTVTTPPAPPSQNFYLTPGWQSPQAPTTAPPAVNAVQDDTTQKRINDLMSAKDKAIFDASRAQQDLLATQQAAQAKIAEYATQLEGATTATQALMAEKSRMEAENLQLKAQTLKAQTLMQYPDLVPYADFIPATTDEAAMKATIERLQQVRQQDFAKITPAPAAAAPVASQPQIPSSMRGLYPNTAIPSAQAPAVANGQTDYATAFAQWQTRMGQLNPMAQDYDSQRAALLREGEALARQQFNA